MYFQLNMGIFHCYVLVYQRVSQLFLSLCSFQKNKRGGHSWQFGAQMTDLWDLNHVMYFQCFLVCLFDIWSTQKTTLQETNISPKNGVLKMIFLFPRWDMLIPWRVGGGLKHFLFSPWSLGFHDPILRAYFFKRVGSTTTSMRICRFWHHEVGLKFSPKSPSSPWMELGSGWGCSPSIHVRFWI